MNELEKQSYIKLQKEKIEGAKVILIETKIKGKLVFLESLTLKQLNGDEFIVRTFVDNDDCSYICVNQTSWGGR